MDLIYFLKVLYRKKWIILGISFLAVVAAFIYLFNKKPLFESVAQYSTGFTAEKVRLVDGSSAIDFYTVDVKFNNVIETMKSPQVVDMLSYKLLLHDLEFPNAAYRKLTIKDADSKVYKEVNIDTAKFIFAKKINTNSLLNSDNDKERQLIEFLKLYNYDYDGLLKYLSIDRVEGTDYLDITFRSENRELSALVVNSIGTQFLNYYKNLNSQRTEENAQSIKAIVDSQQNKVEAIQQRLATEKQSQGSIDPVSKTTTAMETVKELETNLTQERAKYNEHSNRVDYLQQELNSLQSGMNSSAGSNDEVLQLRNRKSRLLDELSSKGGNDPALQKEIDDLTNRIISLSSNSNNKSKTADNISDLSRQLNEEKALLNASTKTIEDYNAQIRQYEGLAYVNPTSGVKVDALQTELDIANKQLASSSEKYSQAEGLMRDDPTANFIQTRVGQAAVDPESKKTMVTMALTGVSVFFLVSIIFIFLEIFDPSVKTPSIFQKLTKLKVIGVLNKVKFKNAYPMDLVMQESDEKHEAFEGQGMFKNNIRKLRYEIINSGKNIFLFTSTKKASGKSTVIEALATSLLLSKKKVLIIDLNFSHNSLTKIFNTDKLIQEIGGRINYSSPLDSQNLWSKTMYDNLYVIGCKETSKTPSEVLYNIDIPALLHGLRQYFDYILIEGAALNNYSDSKELAQYTEAVITVYSAESSVSQTDTASLRFIAGLGEKNHHVILNDVLTENINF